MAEGKMIRLNQVARKLNVGIDTVVEFLNEKGFEVERSPNTKISSEQYDILSKEYADSANEKEEASTLTIGTKSTENVVIKAGSPSVPEEKSREEEILIKDNTADTKPEPVAPKEEEVKKEEPEAEEKPKEEPATLSGAEKLQGFKVVGKIDLDKGKKKKEEPKAEAPKVEEKKEEPKVEAPKAEEKKEEPKVEAPKVEEKKEEAKVEPPKAEEKKEEEPKVETPKAAAETTKEGAPKPAEEAAPEENKTIAAKADSLRGLKVLGKIELPETRKKSDKPVASSDAKKDGDKKRPRKRISRSKTQPGGGPGAPQQRGGSPGQGGGPQRGGGKFSRDKKKVVKEELTDKEIQDKIKATLAKLSGGKTNANVSRSKYRKDKRSAVAEATEERLLQEQEDSKTLKVTEFISANDLASLLGVSVNDIISTCMSLGMFVSINQRLDAESITIIADEFGFAVEFTTHDDEVDVAEEEDEEGTLIDRAPIVTIMGHVDHGKTSLLDYIRDASVTEGEAGGITQHIGAYDVMTSSGKRVAFLDTPGHEAFTAMRARGAKITDIVIIVVAADDDVMPQTKEAINHAQVAGVPIIIAINKVDKPQANPDKIKEALSQNNILVEDWGGKYQCQEISAKTGQGIEDLLEKVLLEAEVLELTANPNKKAVGSVIEATLDKGRGYVTTMMVQSGTLNVGDVVLAGSFFGKVKAMFDHTGKKLKKAGPSTPLQMLGLDGAAQAGDKFNVMDTDREAREIATKREQIVREQSIRTKKHITLDEIGRRLAIGSFKELNVIVKGDVDGSVEALSDSLLKLSTSEVQVNIIHKGVGQISESDVLLASASDAVIIGFQVRPSGGAKKIAEKDEIEIRLYSIIYDAINDVKDAMEGLLAPTVEEIITGNIEVRDVFKISKVGTVAGCYVTDGYVKRANNIRLIRDGIVTYEGQIGQLKRFKDDVQEVKYSYECGISIKGFNDIKIGDVIEGYEQREVKRSL
ncbi:bacterial translation initiation factor 2 (bIF-2) [Reichenbachiella agariperforans]|uniref:Translation initiation factor IF-2 n=1 Tax=Reichenbachiella agariperforans TaxID=156994 RepID=A0A1M6N8I1_REIAG|nr:translation initiation factor IF-2 [Reichenbachiella agariperforans]SHJ91973.1 bacterial translation initiation factor 2 (bIF-2) [Reichenbachiella agariperforans]